MQQSPLELVLSCQLYTCTVTDAHDLPSALVPLSWTVSSAIVSLVTLCVLPGLHPAHTCTASVVCSTLTSCPSWQLILHS